MCVCGDCRHGCVTIRMDICKCMQQWRKEQSRRRGREGKLHNILPDGENMELNIHVCVCA